jgi:hypothetical protein
MALATVDLLTAVVAVAYMDRSLYRLAVYNPDARVLFTLRPARFLKRLRSRLLIRFQMPSSRHFAK